MASSTIDTTPETGAPRSATLPPLAIEVTDKIAVPVVDRTGAAKGTVEIDPRGRITVVGEDEAEQAGDAWSQGDVLPREVPHITLDYAAYGLPTPSLGEKYARVGNEVLRIDTGSRRIVEVVAR